LSWLDVSRNPIGIIAAAALASSLAANVTLTHLSVAQCSIGGVGVAAIVNALSPIDTAIAANKHISDGNGNGDDHNHNHNRNHNDGGGGSSGGSGSGHVSVLSSLNLSGNVDATNAPSNGTGGCGGGGGNNNNNLGVGGGVGGVVGGGGGGDSVDVGASLCRLLSTNTTVRHLSLSANRFGRSDLKRLTAAVKANHSLRSLDLSVSNA
jgi:hypothetical protein